MAGSSVLVHCIFCSVLLFNGKIFIHKMTSCKPTDLRALKGWSLAVRRQVSHELPLVQRLRPRYVCYASAFCDDGSRRAIAPCGLFRVRRCHWRESQDRSGPSVQPSPLKAFEKRTGPRQDVPSVPHSHQQPTPKPLSHASRYLRFRPSGRDRKLSNRISPTHRLHTAFTQATPYSAHGAPHSQTSSVPHF